MQTPSTQSNHAPQAFIEKHQADVIGILHGFDRLRLQGTLRSLYHPASMEAYLQLAHVLWKDFKAFATGITARIRAASATIARATGRPFHYLPSVNLRKEDEARKIALQDGIDSGLIVVFACIEPCRTYFVRGNHESKMLELKLQRGRCLHFYFYQYHPLFGFMYLRLQSWFPFLIHIGLNGREWLARQTDAAGLSYQRTRNCFTALENIAAAQTLFDRQLQSDWPALCNQLVRDFHPLHEEIGRVLALPYYWTVCESEYASDVIFREATTLQRLYPHLLHHAITSFGSREVLRFLGRRASTQSSGQAGRSFQGEVTSDLRQRAEGIRIKHRRDSNSIKLYDKAGNVLRTETTINQPRDFYVYRRSENAPQGKKSWRILRRGIADLYRRAEICQAANRRYLDALAAVSAGTSLAEEAVRVCKPVRKNGRRHRALNPLSSHDAALLGAVNRGEFALNGLRNRDLRILLFGDSPCLKTRRRQAAAITRKLRLLRAHGLIQKVSHTHRYHVTAHGRRIIIALLSALNADVEQLTKIAA
jgi:hypothetical protein